MAVRAPINTSERRWVRPFVRLVRVSAVPSSESSCSIPFSVAVSESAVSDMAGEQSDLANELARQLQSPKFFNVLKDAVRAVRIEEKAAEELSKKEKKMLSLDEIEEIGSSSEKRQGPKEDNVSQALQQLVLTLKGGKLEVPPELEKDEIDRLPANFSMPQFTLFKGDSNPAVHVSNYENVMRMKGVTDRKLAKMFPLTLTGDPADWLDEQPEELKLNWKLLSRDFKERYAYTKKIQTTIQSLEKPSTGAK